MVQGNSLRIRDVIGGLPSPTAATSAFIVPNPEYFQAIKFERFAKNRLSNVQFGLRDFNQFDIKDCSFSYLYINDIDIAYSYDTLVSVGFDTAFFPAMPNETICTKYIKATFWSY